MKSSKALCYYVECYSKCYYVEVSFQSIILSCSTPEKRCSFFALEVYILRNPLILQIERNYSTNYLSKGLMGWSKRKKWRKNKTAFYTKRAKPILWLILSYFPIFGQSLFSWRCLSVAAKLEADNIWSNTPQLRWISTEKAFSRFQHVPFICVDVPKVERDTLDALELLDRFNGMTLLCVCVSLYVCRTFN